MLFPSSHLAQSFLNNQEVLLFSPQFQALQLAEVTATTAICLKQVLILEVITQVSELMLLISITLQVSDLLLAWKVMIVFHFPPKPVLSSPLLLHQLLVSSI